AQLDGPRDADGHPAILERAGGVFAFILHVERIEAEFACEAVAAVQASVAFAKRDASCSAHRQKRRVAPYALLACLWRRHGLCKSDQLLRIEFDFQNRAASCAH